MPNKTLKKKLGKKNRMLHVSAKENTADKEKELAKRLDQLRITSEDMNALLQQRVAENEWLQEEVDRMTKENREYLSYMEKRSNRRLNLVVTLSEYNREELNKLNDDKLAIITRFEAEKHELKNVLLQKESALIKKQEELRKLKDVESIKQEQDARIRELEDIVRKRRRESTKRLDERKKEFLAEKQQVALTARETVDTLVRQAKRETAQMTSKLIISTRQSNAQLRFELARLLRCNRALHERVRELAHQYRQLASSRSVAARSTSAPGSSRTPS